MREQKWFQRLKYQISPLFSGRGYRFSKENDHFYQKTMKRFGEWNKKLRDKHKILNEMADDGKDIQVIGIMDGYRGQNPAAMKRIVDHVASLWQAYIEPTFREQLAIAQNKLTDLENFLNYLKEKKSALVDNQRVVNADNYVNSKHYNLILGLGYLIISTLLILADFPLSIKVVKEGFQITNDFESRILALGIVLVTIYFKVFYDEYIGNSIPKSLLKKRIGFILGNKPEVDLSGSLEDRNAKQSRAIKLGVKLIILTLLVVTLWSMGQFRSEYMAISPATSGTFSHLMTSGNTTNLFILLSITFPIIGGICASLGINSLQNVLDKYSLALRLWVLQLRIQRHEKRKSAVQGLILSCEENLHWVRKDGDFIKESSAYFFSSYLHGFEWGLNEKLPNDFYDAAMVMRVQHSKIQSTRIFYEEMAKSTKDSAALHSLFFPNQIKQIS